MAKANTKTAKRGRGRPVIPVNFNFGKNSFTIDTVLARYRGRISRATVYNKIQQNLRSKTMREVGRVPGDGRGHPTYQYRLNPARKRVVKQTAPAVKVAE